MWIGRWTKGAEEAERQLRKVWARKSQRGEGCRQVEEGGQRGSSASMASSWSCDVTQRRRHCRDEVEKVAVKEGDGGWGAGGKEGGEGADGSELESQ